MRKTLYFAFLLLMVLTFSGSFHSSQGPLFLDDEVLVKLRSLVKPEVQMVLDAVGGSLLKEYASIGVLRIKLPFEMDIQTALRILRRLAPVEYAEPNYIIKSSLQPNDPEFRRLWGLNNSGQTGGSAGADVRAVDAWNITTGSAQVVVGVFDSGIDLNHPDLQQNIFINNGEDAWQDVNDPSSGNQIDDDGNGYVDDWKGYNFVGNSNNVFDDNGHGTHVAGIVGAVGNNAMGITGVNWRVKLLPVKLLNAAGNGNVASAIDAIEYVSKMQVKVINCSWGGPDFSNALYDAMTLASSKGILFIAAAGNNGVNTDQLPEYPAAFDLPNIISVAATDHFDRRALWGDDEDGGNGGCGFNCSSVMAAVPGSNFGPQTVDLAAPGKDIYSTIPGGYAFLSGTSMATPYVTGAAALLLAKRNDLRSQDIKNTILNSVDPITAFTGLSVTGGRLNLYKALSALQ